ncbi:transposase family protein [Amycolatopsis sp. MtRt-6]|uniref:transposase family protein n=1 Tax=Amycolatopsis sp. MtRt-6 TaxID=2792782 RepID=UPI001A8C1E53|nr:transposase family protein [Amycolatopsis sp. MtRt-6]
MAAVNSAMAPRRITAFIAYFVPSSTSPRNSTRNARVALGSSAPPTIARTYSPRFLVVPCSTSPRELAQYAGRLLRAERRERGTRNGSRALTCFYQAVFALRWFRENRDIAALARDHGISRATGYRYLDEVITALATQAPDWHEALQQAHNDDATQVILDGKLFGSDRLGEQTISVKGRLIDAWYSGKAHEPGGNIQALCAPDGFPLWVADVEPGSTHDLTAARAHVLAALYWAASQLNLPTLADGGYDGAGIGVFTPVKQPSDGRAAGSPESR